MVFLPFYLPNSSLLRQPKLGYSALALWVIGQVRISFFLSAVFPWLTDSKFAGFVAPTRIRARIPRQVDVRAGALGSQYALLRHKLLDPGYRGIGYQLPTFWHFCCAFGQEGCMSRCPTRTVYSFSLLSSHKSNRRVCSLHPSSASSSTPSLSICVETQFSSI